MEIFLLNFDREFLQLVLPPSENFCISTTKKWRPHSKVCERGSEAESGAIFAVFPHFPPGQDNVLGTTIMANGSINGDKWRPLEIV